MDELRVSSKLMNHLISRFIRKKVKRCCGQNVNVAFNQIVVTAKDGDKVRLHLEVDADMNATEFEQMMLNFLGLGDND